jgi:hypothetical protein
MNFGEGCQDREGIMPRARGGGTTRSAGMSEVGTSLVNCWCSIIFTTVGGHALGIVE